MKLPRSNVLNPIRLRRLPWLACLAVIATLSMVQQATAAPANDNLSSAFTIPAPLPQVVTNSNFGATAQAGEPDHSPTDENGGRSIWWKWTPTASGTVTILREGNAFKLGRESWTSR